MFGCHGFGGQRVGSCGVYSRLLKEGSIRQTPSSSPKDRRRRATVRVFRDWLRADAIVSEEGAAEVEGFGHCGRGVSVESVGIIGWGVGELQGAGHSAAGRTEDNDDEESDNDGSKKKSGSGSSGSSNRSEKGMWFLLTKGQHE